MYAGTNHCRAIHMKIKKTRFLITIIALCGFAVQLYAQENKFSQEYAEKQALQQYELLHPPHAIMPMPAPAENEAFLGAHLSRSASLLENSNKERRNPVKILIYGQSIVGSTVFTEQIEKYISEKYPYADISYENRSIGGFSAEQLVRTALPDLYNTTPDLIIFHVYGGEKNGELEQIFSNIRRYTTSDILLLSHTLGAGQIKPDDMQAKYLRYIAAKYDCELADICAEWPKYLADNHLKAEDLLRDVIHPNRNGNWVLAQLAGRHIRYNPLFPSDGYKNIRTYYALPSLAPGTTNPITLQGNTWTTDNGSVVSESQKSYLKFSFTGNRVDVITGHPLKIKQPGTARLILDGKPISEQNIVFAHTRPSPGPGSWWPAIRQIGHTKTLISESWVLKVTAINADSTIFTYRVTGSKTGEDGTGSSQSTFISHSGRVVIQPEDIMFNRIRKYLKVSTLNGFEVKWLTVPLFQSNYQPPLGTDLAKTYQITLIHGINNSPHTLEIIPNGDGPVPILSLEVFEPGLK
jgi:hypothetical protein